MRNRIVILILALAIAMPAETTIAAPKSPKLAKCDGKQRRPANPHGSILPTIDPQTGETKPASQPQGKANVEVFPSQQPAPEKRAQPEGKAEPIVPPISSALPQRHTASC